MKWIDWVVLAAVAALLAAVIAAGVRKRRRGGGSSCGGCGSCPMAGKCTGWDERKPVERTKKTKGARN